jgi:hypothetical protein
MTREQMLHQMGIKDEELRDYLRKLCAFLDSLDASQREFHYKHSAKKPVEEVARSFGPDVKARDIEHLFAECPPRHGICIFECC